MEKMNDLKDLLKHEIQDLYSAEEQIIAALPDMIDKAGNSDLKKALQDHLRVTKQQLSRLRQVQAELGGARESEGENKGLFSRLFKSRQVCRGMEGLIDEGNKIMSEDMHQDVLDAVIIASAQKMEHYEICGYGTARSFARELGLEKVAQLLEQTLNEEYSADDLLTQLAIGHINQEAQVASRRAMPATERRDRDTGTRRTSEEKRRRPEPEMEMASSRNRTTATTKRTSAVGKAGAAPKSAEVSRSTTSAGRTAGTKRSTAAVSSRGAETKSVRGSSRSSASGRSGTSGRSNSRGR